VREQADLLDDVAHAAAQLDGVGARNVWPSRRCGRMSFDQPLTMRMVVVLPQPEGPISTQVVRRDESSRRRPAGRAREGFADVLPADHAAARSSAAPPFEASKKSSVPSRALRPQSAEHELGDVECAHAGGDQLAQPPRR